MPKNKIGFIGQGFVGTAMADDFQNRGHDIIRYSLEPQYIANKQLIAECDIVFIAVPTPTIMGSFDLSIVESSLKLIGVGSIAVIKSTILPGTTQYLQNKYPNIIVMHSPEFLREKSAKDDAAHPERNIIGITSNTKQLNMHAEHVLSYLPDARYTAIVSSSTAECIKYIGNTFLYSKLVFMNMAKNFVNAAGGNWEEARSAIIQDHRIGSSHTTINCDDGLGAGGHCFIKDYEAFLQYYKNVVNDPLGQLALEAYRDKNNDLLVGSNKDIELLEQVYGSTYIEKQRLNDHTIGKIPSKSLSD